MNLSFDDDPQRLYEEAMDAISKARAFKNELKSLGFRGDAVDKEVDESIKAYQALADMAKKKMVLKQHATASNLTRWQKAKAFFWKYKAPIIATGTILAAAYFFPKIYNWMTVSEPTSQPPPPPPPPTLEELRAAIPPNKDGNRRYFGEQIAILNRKKKGVPKEERDAYVILIGELKDKTKSFR